MEKDIDLDEAVAAYEKAKKAFNDYLDVFGGPEALMERTHELFEYAKYNKIDFLALMFKHFSPMIQSLGAMEKGGATREELESFTTKIMLVFLDAMEHAGYINCKFIEENMKAKNFFRKEFEVQFPKDLVEKVKKDNKKKKNGKK